jgi:hypothetical protein
VEFDDGSAIDYANVGSEVWKRFSTSGAAWSFYRDNIEEEFAGTRGRAAVASQAGRTRRAVRRRRSTEEAEPARCAVRLSGRR